MLPRFNLTNAITLEEQWAAAFDPFDAGNAASSYRPRQDSARAPVARHGIAAPPRAAAGVGNLAYRRETVREMKQKRHPVRLIFGAAQS